MDAAADELLQVFVLSAAQDAEQVHDDDGEALLRSVRPDLLLHASVLEQLAQRLRLASNQPAL